MEECSAKSTAMLLRLLDNRAVYIRRQYIYSENFHKRRVRAHCIFILLLLKDRRCQINYALELEKHLTPSEDLIAEMLNKAYGYRSRSILAALLGCKHYQQQQQQQQQ